MYILNNSWIVSTFFLHDYFHLNDSRALGNLNNRNILYPSLEGIHMYEPGDSKHGKIRLKKGILLVKTVWMILEKNRTLFLTKFHSYLRTSVTLRGIARLLTHTYSQCNVSAEFNSTWSSIFSWLPAQPSLFLFLFSFLFTLLATSQHKITYHYMLPNAILAQEITRLRIHGKW